MTMCIRKSTGTLHTIVDIDDDGDDSDNDGLALDSDDLWVDRRDVITLTPNEVATALQQKYKRWKNDT